MVNMIMPGDTGTSSVRTADKTSGSQENVFGKILKQASSKDKTSDAAGKPGTKPQTGEDSSSGQTVMEEAPAAEMAADLAGMMMVMMWQPVLTSAGMEQPVLEAEGLGEAIGQVQGSEEGMPQKGSLPELLGTQDGQSEAESTPIQTLFVQNVSGREEGQAPQEETESMQQAKSLTEPESLTGQEAAPKEISGRTAENEDAPVGEKAETQSPDVAALAGKEPESAVEIRPQAGMETTATAQTEKSASLEELPQRFTEMITEGEREIEISLEPRELGKLTIKASYEEGRAVISIVCSNEKTAQLLSSHANSLGAILETNLGSPAEILLEKGAWENADENALDADGRNGQENRKEENKKKKRDSGESFLQQLRLGLV